MNPAELITEDILGESFKTIVLNGKAYTLKPPTYKTISRVIRHLSKINMGDEYTHLSILGEIPENGAHIVKAIACAFTENRIKSFLIERSLRRCTIQELKMAIEAIIEMMGGKDFFHIASLAKSVIMTAARPK